MVKNRGVGHGAEPKVAFGGLKRSDISGGGHNVERDSGDTVVEGFWADFVADPALAFPGGAAAPAGDGGGVGGCLEDRLVATGEAPFLDHLGDDVVNLVLLALERFHLDVETAEGAWEAADLGPMPSDVDRTI